MTIKASAGAVLMLAAGLFVSVAEPSTAMAAAGDGAAASKSEAATAGKSVRQGSRYGKKRYSYRKYTRTASKTAETRRTAGNDVTETRSNQPAIPGWVANANAQMTSADASSDSPRAMSEAMSAKANMILLASADKLADGQPATGSATAPDQLNDVDRALQETPSTQTVAMALVKPAQEAPVLASSSDSLDKTSLIGKIFIGFGALLTMASAARMLLA